MSRRSEGEAGRDDPVAMLSPRMVAFFASVMRRQLRRSFRAIRLARPGLPDLAPDRPLIVYSNHPSWWDPVMFITLAHTCLPGRQAYGPMEASALERYGFMRRIGIFGVDPDTRAGAARFLDVSRRVLSDPSRFLFVTAQGDFADPRDRPVTLRSGVAHLMARIPDAQAVPLALEYPFWSEKRAEALAAFGQPLDARTGGTARDWTPRLEAALAATMDDLAARAAARDPAGFERLLEGRAGVGGVYEIAGRVRAWASGRRYAADHMEDRT